MIIIGANGYIGQKLYEHFSEKEESVVGTYCHSSRERLQYFNLEQPDLSNLNTGLGKTRIGIICSSINHPDECKADEDKAYRVNVKGTKELIEQLFNKDIFPVFLSSGFVFDGKRGNYSEYDKPNPCTVYGNHKRLIEEFLLTSDKPFLVVRISKIFGLTLGDGTLLTSWIEQLHNNESIKCATDQKFSFTYIGDFVKILDISLERKLEGIYNFASPECFSKFELATLLKKQLNIKTGQITPCSINDFNFLDPRSPDTSLNPEKIIQETGFEFHKMRDCINQLEKLLGV